jgi:hypothetical protein
MKQTREIYPTLRNKPIRGTCLWPIGEVPGERIDSEWHGFGKYECKTKGTDRYLTERWAAAGLI